MNKKAFVLMETIVVIVVISVALLTIFASYNKILSKVKTENKYDTSEYIYMTKYVRDYLRNKSCVIDSKIFSMSDVGSVPINFFEDLDCMFSTSENPFKIKKIYVLNKLNETKNESLIKFDAYMIDYIRKLDVGDNDTILVVEYERTALDIQGEPIEDTKNNTMNDTYIASLEW